MSEVVLIKVGTLDDPSVFDPQMAIYTGEMQRIRMAQREMAGPSTSREPISQKTSPSRRGG